MHEARAGNMRLSVRAAAAFGVGKVVPAVEYDPVGIVEVRREVADGDKSGEHESRDS